MLRPRGAVEYSYAVYGLGFAELEDGRLDRAAALALEAIEVKHPFPEMLGLSLTFDLLSWTRAAEGAWEQAATVMGAAHASWPSFGTQLFGSAHWLARRQDCEARIVAAIGAAAFRRAFERGRTTDLARAPLSRRPARTRGPDPAGARDRRVGHRGPLQPRDRPHAAHLPADGRGAPPARLHQARLHQPRPTRRVGRRRAGLIAASPTLVNQSGCLRARRTSAGSGTDSCRRNRRNRRTPSRLPFCGFCGFCGEGMDLPPR